MYSSVKSNAVLAEDALRQIMQDVMKTQCLSFLCHVWCRGVVHRDLKLENLLLATPNDIHKVKIADFGLAKKAAECHGHHLWNSPVCSARSHPGQNPES